MEGRRTSTTQPNSWHLLATLLVLLLAGSIATGRNLDQLLSPDSWPKTQIAPGVELGQKKFTNLFEAPQFISLLTVDLRQTNTQIRIAAAQQFGKDEMIVPELGEKSGAIAAINGGFFGSSTANYGILKINGELLPFKLDASKDLHFVGGSAFGIDKNGAIHFTKRPQKGWINDWPEVEHALAGGHHLILNGAANPEFLRTNYVYSRERSHILGRHPRTAIGVTTNNLALFLVADGRHRGNAEGLNLPELAEVMKKLGCHNAINLDGGGSSTVWLRDKGIVNYPSDNKKFDHNGPRKVRTAVIVLTE